MRNLPFPSGGFLCPPLVIFMLHDFVETFCWTTTLCCKKKPKKPRGNNEADEVMMCRETLQEQIIFRKTAAVPLSTGELICEILNRTFLSNVEEVPSVIIVI